MVDSLGPRRHRIPAGEVEVCSTYVGDDGCHVPSISHETMERMRRLIDAYLGIFLPQTTEGCDTTKDPYIPESAMLSAAITQTHDTAEQLTPPN